MHYALEIREIQVFVRVRTAIFNTLDTYTFTISFISIDRDGL
jgi:hypothetical protein